VALKLPPYAVLEGALRCSEVLPAAGVDSSDVKSEDGSTAPVRSLERDRSTRGAVLVAAGLFLAACAIGAAYRAGWAAGISEAKENVELAAVEGKCHTPEKGDPCYSDIIYAQNKYIKSHPDWYPGLNTKSTFKDVQHFLHNQRGSDGERRCPRPCGYATKKRGVKPSAGTCQTARRGSDCWTHVMYTSRQIPEHPEWYVGLTKESSFLEVQEYLSHQTTEDGESVCPLPCGKEKAKKKPKDCHTTQKGEQCYDAVHWVRSVGWKLHPKWFPGITSETSPEETQDYLCKHKGSHCHRPSCPCHKAQPGEECYTHVRFTMKEDLPNHPQWFQGLTVDASFEQVQAYLAQEKDADGKQICEEPCGLHAAETNSSDDNTTDCHTAEAGEQCYDQVLYAMEEVGVHPEWYEGLTNESSLESFQELLHRGKKDDEGKRCPRPCNLEAIKNVSSSSAAGFCHTAVRSEPCWDDVLDVHFKKLQESPDLYKGLSASSTFEDIQMHISNSSGAHCEHRPCPCHTAVAGDMCYRHVMWVKKVGIKKHPRRFEGLTVHSSVEEIQYRLHPIANDHCLLPCVVPWSRLEREDKTHF
jgi:hypothetical protein